MLNPVKNIINLDYQKHHHVLVADEINQIVKPLEKYGITYFGFSSVNAEQEESFLTSRADMSHIFYEGKFYENLFCDNFEKYFSANILWRDIMDSNQYAADLLNHFSESFNVSNGLSMIRKHKDRVDHYYFATERNHIFMNAFYLSHIDLFEAFIDYFDHSAKTLLNDAYENRVYVPNCQDQTILTSSELDIVSGDLLESFGKIKRLNYFSEFYRLTPREAQCVNFLFEGLQPKALAAELSISPRTVEKFIAGIKQKTKSKTLVQALCKLL